MFVAWRGTSDAAETEQWYRHTDTVIWVRFWAYCCKAWVSGDCCIYQAACQRNHGPSRSQCHWMDLFTSLELRTLFVSKWFLTRRRFSNEKYWQIYNGDWQEGRMGCLFPLISARYGKLCLMTHLWWKRWQ